MKKRAHILSIAGFDPSGGAGIIADMKTIEAHRCLGMGVQTANTIQTATEFQSVSWTDADVVKKQLNLLTQKYPFAGVKIGLIQSFEMLAELLDENELSPSIKVWDPVLSASAGFNFHSNWNNLTEVLKKVDWITPNWLEMQKLGGEKEVMEAAKEMSSYTNVYLKGGHNESNPGKDYWIKEGVVKSFNPREQKRFEKHGSGCVFSAALVANLVRGYPETKAILRTKRYVERFLNSSPLMLGKHYG